MFGKVLIGYVSSLVVAFIFLIVINEKFVVLGPFCTVSGFCLYFSLILCFSFLNVMGFDLWSNITGNRRNVQSKKKFLLYMAYAFGVPTLFLLLIVLLDKTGLYTTSIGTNSCFFWDKDTAGDIWVYFYIPILIALAANTFFFVKTADHIRQTKKEISARDNAKKDIHNYWMFVRLFLLMGLTWILEMLAQLTEWDIFHLTDILNCLQGVMIFFSFAYQGKTKKLVKEK
jgi:G protein-coupled receptor Mth (Methuselah protein)